VLDVLDANDAVRGGQTVQYSVIPVYGSSGNVAPIGLRIEAYGNKGFASEDIWRIQPVCSISKAG
jgi:hypothetical protein